MKRFATAFALAMLISSRAPAQAPILKSLPSDVQQRIEGIRESCPSTERVTKGDEGLQFFTVSGAQAVKVFSQTLEQSFAGWRKDNSAFVMETQTGGTCTPDGGCN